MGYDKNMSLLMIPDAWMSKSLKKQKQKQKQNKTNLKNRMGSLKLH